MSSPSSPDAEGLMLETALIIDREAKALGLDVFDDLERENPAVSLAMRLGSIFDTVEAEDHEGFEVVEGIDNQTGEFVNLKRKISVDGKAGFKQAFALHTSEQQFYFSASYDESGEPKTTLVGTGVNTQTSLDDKLAALAEVVDRIESNVDLVDGRPVVSARLDNANPIVEGEKTEPIFDAVSRLDSMFQKQTDLAPGEDPDLLTGVGFHGQQYSIARNHEEIADPDKQYELNTVHTTGFVIKVDIDGDNEQCYRLEVYEDVLGELRYELEGSDFTEGDSETAKLANFISVIKQLDTHAVWMPFSYKKD